MSAAKELNLPFSNLTSYSIGIMKVTQFGVLKDVEHNDLGWVIITNEDGETVQMKKIYAGWLGVFQKAQKLIGKPIVYETGVSAPAADYFRDIHEDNPNKPMLTFPDSTSDEAKMEIILGRLSASMWKWQHDKAQDSLATRAEEMERQRVALTLLEKQDYDEVKLAAEELDREWASSWEANPERKLLLQGAANHGGRIQNLDRKFMLRLNADISDMRQLPVTVIGRGDSNYVRVKLPTFDNVVCEVGLKRSTQRGTKGKWGVCTVKNEYDDWFKVEGKMYPNATTFDWDLAQCADAHQQMIEALAEREQTKLDVAFDQIGDVQIISA